MVLWEFRQLTCFGHVGASAMAVGVLAHVAAEYLVNFGRAIRFYSDRYGYKMSTEVSLSTFCFFKL